jgi:aspartate aminotransferase
MGSIQSHATSNPNTIAQYATLKALSDPRGEEFLTEMRGTFDKRRKLMVQMLTAAGQKIIEPKGAFYVMIDVTRYFGKTYNGKKIDGAQAIAELLLDDEYVAVVPCESFGAPDFIRLSYACSEAQIEKGLKRIDAFFKKLG